MKLDPDVKLSELTVAQFADLLEYRGDLAMARAREDERLLSERIFGDIRGVSVACTPFRIRTAEELGGFTAEMNDMFAKGGLQPGQMLVIAMAIASDDGTVSPMPWEKKHEGDSTEDEEIEIEVE